LHSDFIAHGSLIILGSCLFLACSDQMDVNWICTALCMRSSNSNLVGPTGWEELMVNKFFCLKRSFS
jgi:hypothetical protein